MARSSLLALLVAIGGLILIWRTLVATRAAAESAADTLRIATDTLAETREISYHELKAYAGVGAGNYTFTRNQDGSAGLGVTFEMKNFGQTPAYNFQSSIRLELVTFPGIEEIQPAPFNSNGYTLNIGNTPSGSVGMHLSIDQVISLVNQSARIFANVALQYTDYKGKRRWERIHFVLPSIGNGNLFMNSHGGVQTPASMTYYRTESSDDQEIN